MKTRPARQPRSPSSIHVAPGKSDLLPAVWLVLLAFVVYAPALSGGFIWDDNTLTSNPLLKTWTGLWRIWTWPSLMSLEVHYWPLVYSSFWLENLLGGGHLPPVLLHFDNILLHAATVVLLWRVLVRFNVPGAWLGAALFAIHPVHAESVAWIIERKDVLSGALYFAAALAYLRYEECGIQNSEFRIQKSDPTTHNSQPILNSAFRIPHSAFNWYCLAIACFVGAMFSKSVAVTFPVALALALWWRGGRLTRRGLRALAPFFILALVITLADLRYGQILKERAVEESGLALPERLQMAGRALWVYLGKLAWPWPLAMFYPKWAVGRASLGAWIPLLAWPALLLALWFGRRRLGRGPLTATIFFGLTLAPAIGIVDFEYFHYSWVADRFQYLASAGPLALAGAGLAILARRFRWAPPVLLAVLALLCLRQAALYRDSVAFFRACADAYPACWPAYAKLSLELRNRQRFEDAAKTCREGLSRLPDEYHLTQELARALEQQQQFAEAEVYYQKTLKLKPDFANGRIGYGLMLASRGDLEGAKAQYKKELEFNPDDAVAMNNLGTILRAQQKTDEALKVLDRAVTIRPQYLDCRYNLALVLLDAGKFAEAAGHCRMILDVSPDHAPALNALGVALLAQRKPAEAVQYLARSLALQPGSPNTLYLMGETYAMLGQPREAVYYYQETLKLRPNDPGALRGLRAFMGSAQRR